MISVNTTPLQLWNGKTQSRPLGKQLFIRECCARRAYRVMAQLSRPLISTNRNEETVLHMCKLACHGHVSTLFTGHNKGVYTPTWPIGIAKLCEVFMNAFLSSFGAFFPNAFLGVHSWLILFFSGPFFQSDEYSSWFFLFNEFQFRN